MHAVAGDIPLPQFDAFLAEYRTYLPPKKKTKQLWLVVEAAVAQEQQQLDGLQGSRRPPEGFLRCCLRGPQTIKNTMKDRPLQHRALSCGKLQLPLKVPKSFS